MTTEQQIKLECEIAIVEERMERLDDAMNDWTTISDWHVLCTRWDHWSVVLERLKAERTHVTTVAVLAEHYVWTLEELAECWTIAKGGEMDYWMNPAKMTDELVERGATGYWRELR